jgi:hypothetical protein
MRNDLKYIKMDSFSEWSTLTNNNNITFLHCKSWRAVNGNISMSFLIPIVFRDVMKVVTSDNDGSLHFGGDADSFDNFASDTHFGSKGTLFIDILALDSFFRGFES